MHYLAFFFSLVLFANTALASGAYGYETVFFYYAYLMDYRANGAAATIAPGCRGSPCTLSQFIAHIQGAAPGSAGAYAGNQFATTTPDPLIDGQAIQDPRSGYNGVFVQGNLLPEFANTKVPQATVLATLTDKAQAALKKMPGSFSAELDVMQKAMSYVLGSRIADNMAGMLQTLKIQRPAMTIVTKQVTNPDGTTYTALDEPATVAQNKPAKPGKALSDWVTNYLTTDKKGSSHQKTVNAAQQSNSRLLQYQGGCV